MNNSMTPEEVAELLNIKKNTVYELIKRGELTAYRVGRRYRIDPKDIDIYKKKGSRGDHVVDKLNIDKDAVFPDYLVIAGQDILLDVLARYLENKPYGNVALRYQADSMASLNALYHEKVDVATAHLWDGDKDEYNLSYVRCLVPGMAKVIVHLVKRTQGFYVASGNPLNIKGWLDLKRKDVTMVNRERGSGARILFDEKLRKMGIDHREIQGYDQQKLSDFEIAVAVARGQADLGLGIQKNAFQVRGLDFVPLQVERYDMVILKKHIEKPKIQAVFQVIHSELFREDIAAMGDYDIGEMGNVVEIG
ncbi:MAG TPA: helix-turn-helix transcriptional regulator [Syntrophomonadaceae bacterium]|nr:helix-turn-helix transcriptional regulator [Syntrophomonadaceae bacterium]